MKQVLNKTVILLIMFQKDVSMNHYQDLYIKTYKTTTHV